MKRWIWLSMALLLLTALVSSALAAKGTAYVNKDTLNVFDEPDKESKVVKKLKGGDKVVIFEEDGSWTGIFYVNKKDEDRVGYVQSKYLSTVMPEKYCDHQWTHWEVYREATCKRAGLKIRECTVCGTGQSKEIAKLDHEYGKWIVSREATCTEAGEQYRECRLCGNRETKAIRKLDHEYGKWNVLEEATCTEKGERMRRCVVCGYREVQEIEKVPHEYGRWTVTKEASCTRTGERVRSCEVCGYQEKQTLDKLPHEYGSWKVTREATCTREGKRVRTCRVCGGEDSQSIAMLPHDYRWVVTLKTTDHSAGERAKTCQVCGKVAATESFDPSGTLRRGARGDDVRQVQQLLADQGYLAKGGVDGIFGGGLERAVIQFQRDQDLEPDGVVWPQTLKRMRHDFEDWEVVTPLTRVTDGEYVRRCKDCGYEEHKTVSAGVTFTRRQRGEDVRTLQRMLNDLGYSAGTADGIYGQKLDNAFGAFAAENNLESVPEMLRPVDVDNLVGGWISGLSDADWMGKGSKDDPVRLVLTVSPDTTSDQADVDVVTHYNWKLSNLGSERCHFDALLLCYGDAPDFRENNLVMVVGNGELRPQNANSLSGSFSVGVDWGDESLNFCALGTSVKTGAAWLSNVRSYDR